MQISITKPTSLPGEVTKVIAYNIPPNLPDMRLILGRAGKAIDWRVLTENQRKLEKTKKLLKQKGLRIPGF